MTTSPNQIVQTFHTDGYVVLRNFLSEREIQQVVVELDDTLSLLENPREQHDVFYEEDGTTIRQFERLQNHSEWFASMCLERRYLDLFEKIFESTAICDNVSYMAKAAHVGSVVPAHQDNAYFNLVPNHALTFWIALDECTGQNGCLRVVPGSHLGGILPHHASGLTGNSSCLVTAPDPVESGEVKLLLKPGDCSIHHADTIHRSQANTSPKSRRGLLLAYQSVRCRVDQKAMVRHQQIVRDMRAGLTRE